MRQVAEGRRGWQQRGGAGGTGGALEAEGLRAARKDEAEVKLRAAKATLPAAARVVAPP